MPRGNGTGPAGLGSMTGRGMGYCAGYGAPGFMTPGSGLGRGWGRGWGRGYGRGFGWRRFGGYGQGGYPYQPYQPQITKKEEKEMLEDDVTDLEEELKAIKTRLSELKGQK